MTPAPFAAECEALGAVAACARAQLDALRDGEPETFEAAAARTLGAVADLDRRQQARRRAPDVEATPADRALLHAAVAEARAATDDLAFALEHAVALGRDLLGAWQQMTVPATSQVYTARGHVGPAEATGQLQQTG